MKSSSQAHGWKSRLKLELAGWISNRQQNSMCACELSGFSHVWLFAAPMDCSPPGSSVHGILQVRLPEWVAIPSSQGSPRPRDGICVSYVSWTGQQGSLPPAPPGKQNSKRKDPARRQGDMKMEMSPRSSWGYENYSVKVEENIAPL